jgi:hypothetical protein
MGRADRLSGKNTPLSRLRKIQNHRRPSALKHGAFSSAAFFPWENRADFEALHAELIDEWASSP